MVEGIEREPHAGWGLRNVKQLARSRFSTASLIYLHPHFSSQQLLPSSHPLPSNCWPVSHSSPPSRLFPSGNSSFVLSFPPLPCLRLQPKLTLSFCIWLVCGLPRCNRGAPPPFPALSRDILPPQKQTLSSHPEFLIPSPNWRHPDRAQRSILPVC